MLNPYSIPALAAPMTAVSVPPPQGISIPNMLINIPGIFNGIATQAAVGDSAGKPPQINISATQVAKSILDSNGNYTIPVLVSVSYNGPVPYGSTLNILFQDSQGVQSPTMTNVYPSVFLIFLNIASGGFGSQYSVRASISTPSGGSSNNAIAVFNVTQ